MQKLEEYAKRCLDTNQPIQLFIDMPGFDLPELIINPVKNIEKKLEYYKSTYDENCEHKHAKGIRIIDALYTAETSDFGWAIDQLKKGHKVARRGWNGKGMFIYLVNSSEIPAWNLRAQAKEQLEGLYEVTEQVKINAHIDMKAADGSIVIGWLASQTDMLAEDWVIVE